MEVVRSRYPGRDLSPAELEQLPGALLAAKRWTFILSGVTHPRFQELVQEVTTPAQQERIGAALEGLMSQAAAASGTHGLGHQLLQAGSGAGADGGPVSL